MNKLLLAPLIVAAAACSQASAAPPPAAKIDVPAAAGAQTAVFAGGCFWGMEGVFEHVKGVRSVVSGYAGGKAGDADLRAGQQRRHRPCRGGEDRLRSEAGELRPAAAHLLRRARPDLSSTARAPTRAPATARRSSRRTRRSAHAASAYIAQLNAAHAFPARSSRRIESGGFYPAEAYHQGFLRKNPHHPYIMMWDMPKLGDLKRQFPEMWRA